MAEPTPEKLKKQPKFEESPDLKAVVDAAVEAAEKLGEAFKNLGKLVGNIFK